MAMATMSAVESFVDSTPLLSDPNELRKRANAHGYLFFRNLLDPARVLSVRAHVIGACRLQGWLSENTPALNGVAREGLTIRPNQREWMPFYREVQRSRDFHALALEPALLDMFAKVFGESVLPHSRNICRVVFPNACDYTTPPHQDYHYIGGTQETWTAWIPLGDCPAEMGGLALLPGTHRSEILPTHKAEGAGGSGVSVPDDVCWHSGAMAAGDVLVFHSLTVHQGVDNVTGDRLRVSADFRYQPLSHPVRSDSLLPHDSSAIPMTWDEIYRDWEATDPVKYYWKEWALRVEPRTCA